MRIRYVCSRCGVTHERPRERCAACLYRHSVRMEFVADPAPADDPPYVEPEPSERIRVSTGLTEFDRVLGGGLVLGEGVSTLLVGPPGIGKSTIVLQTAIHLANEGTRVLYVTGEETAAQVLLRAKRFGYEGGGDLVVEHCDDVDELERLASDHEPELVVVDSIQTLRDVRVMGYAGGSAQVRAVVTRMRDESSPLSELPIIAIGHVTKDNDVAGPKYLEHLVHAVFYFEGDRGSLTRTLRCKGKNRFGPADQIATFRMTENGLESVENASQTTLLERRTGVPGSALACVLQRGDATRAHIVEVQALVNAAEKKTPLRICRGVERKRLDILMTVLQESLNIEFSAADVHLNVVGSVGVDETALDLPICLALCSAALARPGLARVAAFGEVGLLGEVRSVPAAQLRVSESARLGLAKIAGPVVDAEVRGVTHVAVSDVAEAIEAVLAKRTRGKTLATKIAERMEERDES